MDLKELGLVEPGSHWYYQTKFRVLHQVARRFAPEATKIADVGSGSGFLASKLIADRPAAAAVCIDPNYPRDWDEDNSKIRFVRVASPADLGGTNLFLFVDVLEHVADDVSLLEQYIGNAESGSTVVITVPAFPSMWSAHDVYLEHLRRYRMSGILRVVEEAGLQIEHARYLYAAIFPAAWVVRWFRRTRRAASDLQPVPRFVNAILVAVLNAEHRIRWNRLLGLSILVVARVP